MEQLFCLYGVIDIRLVYNLYVPCFCAYNDFYLQKQIVRTYLAGGRRLSVSTYPSIGTSVWQLACSFVKPTHSSAVLARALWHHSCNCHYTINFTAFLIPNAAFLSFCTG